jgi:hypothetical protein|nr:MAG TPA: Cytochrome C' [Herelleviridae sp.]
MKQKILYTCEVCHTDYETEERAMECENGHKKQLKIVGASYNRIDIVPYGFPIDIKVESENGSSATYRIRVP